MGQCCGAKKSGKKAKKSRDRQERLERIDPPEPTITTRREPPSIHRDDESSVHQDEESSDDSSVDVPEIPVKKVEVPKPSVMDQMPAWKRKAQVLVEDDYMGMSFQGDQWSQTGGVTYWGGKIPSVDQDDTARGKSFKDFSEPDKEVVGIAKEVIANIRSSLTKGPFNNYKNLSEDIKKKQCIPREILKKNGLLIHEGKPAPAWWNAVVEVAALIAAKQLQGKYKDVNGYKLQMACLARATKEVGGGVCSKMAMMTTGELTTALPPGSEIVQLFHKFDHEFVIARVPGSRWFAIDPWCHTPTVIPFVDCSFDPSEVANFVPIKLTETAPKGQPYGLDLDTEVDWKAIIKQAMNQTEIDALEMHGVYGHTDNVNKKGEFAPELGTVSKDKWG